MKIILLSDSLVLQSAGVKQYNLQLLKTLTTYRNLTDLTLIVPRHSAELAAYNQVEVPINALPLHQKWRHFTRIPRKINKLNPDIVIEPAHFGPFRLNKQIKRCTVIHDLTPISHPQFHPLSSRVGHRLTLQPVLGRSDLIITNSESTQITVRRFQPQVKKIQVLSPPIEKRSTLERNQARDSKAYLLAIGTQEPRKDYVTLLQAYAELHFDIDLVIIGGQGWRNTQFDLEFANHPKKSSIRMTGYISDAEKYELMKNASIFVATSKAEGLGLPLLEILPYQTPVICSDLPSFREIGGESFEYFPAGYASVLTEKLIQVCSKLPFKCDFNDRIKSWNMKRKAEVDSLFTTFDAWL